MKVLLHSCCAPCSTVAVERLAAGGPVTMFYYNPNIFPAGEWELRAVQMRRLAQATGAGLLERGGDEAGWRRAVERVAHRGERSARCWICFAWRLNVAAREARARGYDAFTTSLTTTPLKSSKVILRIGRMLGRKHGVRFLEDDFKKKMGFQRSSELTRQLGIYRQAYCGCEWSLQEMKERVKDAAR
ncbi:MAG: epoxyqueuosine reductase QueH [Myxococcota bacterium]|jgi:hypothetical protein